MKTILIIEDNLLNMKLARKLLQKAGYQVLEADCAEEGMQLASSEMPDLILMDIQLPGMDGMEATSRLKANDATKHIPVMGLTALAMSGDKERVLASGCDAYISKPIRYPELYEKVDALMNRDS